MSEEEKNNKRKMDHRCPLGLMDFPTTPCPLALKRLDRLKKFQGNMSHAQEDEWKDDCSYCINDKESNYCFFKYIYRNEGQEHSIIDIAELTNNTQAATYTALHRASEKIKFSPVIRNLRKNR